MNLSPHEFRLLLDLGDTWSDAFEPSMWLRTKATAAALSLAADGPMRPPPNGRVIVPLVPHLPAAQCARCTTPATRHCGFEATSDALPGVTLAFVFRLCDTHADLEYPPGDH